MLKLYYTATAKEEQSQKALQLLLYAWQQQNDLPMPAVQYTKSGKPYFADNSLYFNLSHSAGLALCAVSDKPVGVDIERLRDYREAVGQRVFTAKERALISHSEDFFRLWTKKEAFVKFTGRGLAGLRECPSLTLDDEQREFDGQMIHFSSCILQDYAISICANSADKPEIHEISNS